MFVLVHSLLVGPATWRPTAAALRARGHATVVPALPAEPPLWPRARDAVAQAAADLDGPLVLAGHSGAGLLLPALAEALPRPPAAALFVDAFLPQPAGRAALVEDEQRRRLRALSDDRGVLPPWHAWFGEDAMAELVPDPDLRAELEAEMPGLPLDALAAAVPVPAGWIDGPCGYLLLSPEPYAPAAAQARERGWPVAELPGRHHLSIATDPDAVADALVGLTRAATGS